MDDFTIISGCLGDMRPSPSNQFLARFAVFLASIPYVTAYKLLIDWDKNTHVIIIFMLIIIYNNNCY